MSDIDSLLDERGKTHGPYCTHAGAAQQIKAAIHMWPNWYSLTPDQKESLDMIAHKIGRILAGDPNYIDHWLDVSGYAMLIVNRLRNEQQGNEAD